MDEQLADSRAAPVPMAAAWGAVISMMLGVFALATAEFLPPSVLTPIASDLGITVGLAGQTVTATAALAFLSSLLTPFFTRRLDRRNGRRHQCFHCRRLCSCGGGGVHFAWS